MTLRSLAEAFLINPPIRISKGTVIPFVAMEDVEPFRRDVRALEVRPYSGGAKFMPGDIVMARITPSLENGKVSRYVSDDGTPAAGSTEFIVIRGRDGISDTSFAYYLFTSTEIREFAISQMNGSSGRQRVQTDSLANYRIELPLLPKQRAIAATLGALDDKIESNRRLVDLIPRLVRAMVFDALGAHPGEVAVSDIATFVNGGAYTKGASGTGRIVIRIAELNSGPGGSTVYSDIDVPEEKTARAGDILMSWSGSLGLYRWFRDEAIVNQHIFKVLPSDGYPSWLVFDRLDIVMPVFQGIAKDKATTMGHIQRGHLESTMVEIPIRETVVLLDGLIAPLWQRLLLAEREVVELTALRDELLPEVLSGRIRVLEADGAVA